MLSLPHQKWAQNNLVHDLWTISASALGRCSRGCFTTNITRHSIHFSSYGPTCISAQPLIPDGQRKTPSPYLKYMAVPSLVPQPSVLASCSIAASIDTRSVGVYYGVLGIVYTEYSYRTANWGRKSQYALFWSQVYKLITNVGHQ